MNHIRFGLNEQTIEKIRTVLRNSNKIEEAVVYGSRAKGTHQTGSDIDLTLKGPSLTTTDLLKIENDLDDLMLPYKIDLSLFHQIENPALLEHIQKYGQNIL